MIERAILLRKTIYRWTLAEASQNRQMLVLKMDKAEWLQLQWLQDVLKPFKTWTVALSSSTGATIQNAWFAYNNLNRHMRKMEAVMLMKKAAWGAELATAIRAGMEKLASYWKHGNSPESRIYNLAAILSPSQKLSLYKVCIEKVVVLDFILIESRKPSQREIKMLKSAPILPNLSPITDETTYSMRPSALLLEKQERSPTISTR